VGKEKRRPLKPAHDGEFKPERTMGPRGQNIFVQLRGMGPSRQSGLEIKGRLNENTEKACKIGGDTKGGKFDRQSENWNEKNVKPSEEFIKATGRPGLTGIQLVRADFRRQERRKIQTVSPPPKKENAKHLPLKETTTTPLCSPTHHNNDRV